MCLNWSSGDKGCVQGYRKDQLTKLVRFLRISIAC